MGVEKLGQAIFEYRRDQADERRRGNPAPEFESSANRLASIVESLVAGNLVFDKPVSKIDGLIDAIFLYKRAVFVAEYRGDSPPKSLIAKCDKLLRVAEKVAREYLRDFPPYVISARTGSAIPYSVSVNASMRTE